jgi:hypothetical protein
MVFMKDWQKEEIDLFEFYLALGKRLNRRNSMSSPSQIPE